MPAANTWYKKLPDLQVINRLNPAPNLYRADKELPRGRQLFIPQTLAPSIKNEDTL